MRSTYNFENKGEENLRINKLDKEIIQCVKEEQ